jgi:hypothetical protein
MGIILSEAKDPCESSSERTAVRLLPIRFCLDNLSTNLLVVNHACPSEQSEAALTRPLACQCYGESEEVAPAKSLSHGIPYVSH